MKPSVLMLLAVMLMFTGCYADEGRGPSTTTDFETGDMSNPDKESIQYDSIQGGSNGLLRTISFCELVEVVDAGGKYSVVGIEGFPEEYPQGGKNARTYVTLEKVEGWIGEPNEQIILSIFGGPVDLSRDIHMEHPIALEVGEEIIIFLSDVMRDDDGKYIIQHDLNIFRHIGNGRVTNGQLFSPRGIEENELQEAIDLALTKEKCPFDKDFGLEEKEDEVSGGPGDIEEGELEVYEGW